MTAFEFASYDVLAAGAVFSTLLTVLMLVKAFAARRLRRSVADVGLRLDFLPEFVIGNHGIEGLPGWEGRASRYQSLCTGWEQQLRHAMPTAPPRRGSTGGCIDRPIGRARGTFTHRS